MLRLDDLKALFQQRLAGLAGIPGIKKDVERIKIPVLRVNAIGGKAAAKAVLAVMHRAHALHDFLSAHTAALPGNHR